MNILDGCFLVINILIVKYLFRGKMKREQSDVNRHYSTQFSFNLQSTLKEEG